MARITMPANELPEDKENSPDISPMSEPKGQTENTETFKIQTLNLQTMAAAIKPTPKSISSIEVFDKDSFGHSFKGQYGVMFGQLVEGDIPTVAGTNIFDYVDWQLLGGVNASSTSFTGDDISVTDVKGEDGKIYYTTTQNGTIAFELMTLSTSHDMTEKFMKGSSAQSTVTMGGISGKWKMTGWGSKIPKQNMFIAFVDETLEQMWAIPNAEVTGSIGQMANAENGAMFKLSIKALDHNYPVPTEAKEPIYKVTFDSAS